MPVLAVAQGKEGRIIMLGLNVRDVEQMMAGIPIEGSLEKVTGVKGMRLLVILGPTDEAIKQTISADIRTETLPKESTAEDLTKMLEDAERGEG